jgi:hypothetical protein
MSVSDNLKAATAAIMRAEPPADRSRNGHPSSPTYDHHNEPAGPETPTELASSTGQKSSQTDTTAEKGPELLKAVEGYISR